MSDSLHDVDDFCCSVFEWLMELVLTMCIFLRISYFANKGVRPVAAMSVQLSVVFTEFIYHGDSNVMSVLC